MPTPSPAPVGAALPERIESEAELNEVLTRPGPALVDFVRTLSGRLIILGAGGKMGPTLAVLAHRAAQAAGHPLEVVAVSRFSNPQSRRLLEQYGVQLHAADLLEPADLARLPDADHVIYLVGMKFGTAQNPARTWAINCLAPAAAAQRYPKCRMVALSTGNVYPLVPVDSAGSLESDPLRPVGEYANSCLARERLFEYFSQQNGTPLALIRLNYALDLRYGVLYDIASKVWHGQPVDVTMGYANCIWQGDANDMIIRALSWTQSPARAINLTGLEVLSVRSLALRFAELLQKPVEITGSEAPTALLSNAQWAGQHLQPPATPLDTVMRWTAHWVRQGGASLNKPTHFETRDGGF